MNIEKILSLVAIVVYGLVSIFLSVVRTLKTSRISSEVKSAFPLLGKDDHKDDVQSSEGSADDHPSVDDAKEKDDLTSLQDVLSSFVEIVNRINKDQ